MKKIIKSLNRLIFTGAAMFVVACTGDFEDINTDHTKLTADLTPTEGQLAYVLARIDADGWDVTVVNVVYAESMIQHMAFAEGPEKFGGGDHYTKEEYTDDLWERNYRGLLRDAIDVTKRSADDPEDINVNAAARITKAYIFHRLSDVYGDIPYSEAGDQGNIYPAYDSQEAIYKDLIKELKEAALSFDTDKKGLGISDLLYLGDLNKWKKFANTLRLRLAMRLSEVDAAYAQHEVQSAIGDGVMQSNGDAAYIEKEQSENGNGFETFWGWNWKLQHKISNTFMDHLLDTKNGGANIDPRVTRYTGIYFNGNGEEIHWSNVADFKGLPNGLLPKQKTTIDVAETSVFKVNGVDVTVRGLETYNVPNKNLVSKESTLLLMGYAEAEFLLAEAALRGWGATDAQAHYEEGIRASMEIVSQIWNVETIAADDIENYIANVPAADMEQVLTQKWLSLFLNGYEAWAEYRRTGFPALNPVNYPGNVTNAAVPGRLTYPVEEPARNPDNYRAAVSKLSHGDALASKVWWDID